MPPTGTNLSRPLLSTSVTMKPTSSMCADSITLSRGSAPSRT